MSIWAIKSNRRTELIPIYLGGKDGVAKYVLSAKSLAFLWAKSDVLQGYSCLNMRPNQSENKEKVLFIQRIPNKDLFNTYFYLLLSAARHERLFFLHLQRWNKTFLDLLVTYFLSCVKISHSETSSFWSYSIATLEDLARFVVELQPN